MKAGTLIKSGLTVAGAGVYLFIRKLFNKAKETEKEIEKKIKPKKKTVTKKSAPIPRQKKTTVKSSINM